MTRPATTPALPAVAAIAPHCQATLVGAIGAARNDLGDDLFRVVQQHVHGAIGIVPAASVAQSAVGDFVEQFVTYAPLVTAELRAAADSATQVDLRQLVAGCYVLDQLARLEIVHARLFDAGEFPPVPEPAPEGHGVALEQATLDHHAQVMRLQTLDPETTEAVRICCASYHACDT